MRLREGEQVKPSPQASSAARIKSPHFEPVILNEVKDPIFRLCSFYQRQDTPTLIPP
jgi:hypothetical protein